MKKKMLLLSIFLQFFIFGILFCNEKNHNKKPIRLKKPDIIDLTFVGVNNWSYVMRNQGSFMYDGPDQDGNGNNAGGEFPRGSGRTIVYASGLYVGAKKNSTYVVSQTENTAEFQPGRIINSNVAFSQLSAEDPSASERQVYYIDQSRSGSDYVSWPADAPHDSAVSPALIGDATTWCVFNDLNTTLSSESSAQSPDPGLGLEIRQSSYISQYVNNVIYVRWRITNKTNVNYDSAFVGLWSDPDVNNSSNDVVGSDSSRNLIFCYDGTDEVSPSAVGYQLLYFSGGQEGKVKAYSSSVYANGTDPVNNIERYNYLRGLTKNGQDRPNGRYDFQGNPLNGQGNIDNDPTDKRILLSAGPFTFQAGATQDILFAIIGSNQSTRLGAVADLLSTADTLLTNFDSSSISIFNFDVAPPSLSIRFLQNPEPSLSKFVDMYVAADEPISSLIGSSTINSIKQNFNMTLKNAQDHIYFKDIDLDTNGVVTFEAKGYDLVGNFGNITKNISVSKLIPGYRTLTKSTDDRLEVQFSENAVTHPLCILINDQDDINLPDGMISLSKAYCIGQESYVLNEKFMLSMEVDPCKEKNSNIGIYKYFDEKWNRIGGSYNNGRIHIQADGFGVYKVFANSTESRPAEFVLEQNFPNPFNPTTTIQYRVPSESRVELIVYNILGQKVRTLVSSTRPQGVYRTEWDGKTDTGSIASSGMYFYRLRVADFTQTKKMLFLK